MPWAEWHCTSFNDVFLHTNSFVPVQTNKSTCKQRGRIYFVVFLDLGSFECSVSKSLSLIEVPHSPLHYFTSGSSCNWFVADVAKICHWGPGQKAICALYLFFVSSLTSFKMILPQGSLSLLPSLPWQPLIHICFSIYRTWWFNPALSLHGTINWTQTMTGSLRNPWHSAAGGKLRGNQLF